MKLKLLLILFVSLLAYGSAAATRVITSLADNGPGTLREAIQLSDFGDFILFPSGVTGVISLSNSLPAINVDLTIVATNLETVTINGNNNYTIFSINSGRTVVIMGLVLVSGGGAFGGTFNNSGNLTMNDCTIGNSVGTFFIFNSGPLALNRCRIANNRGTIYNQGSIAINSSLIADNDAASSLLNNFGTLTITNSTFSRNYISSGNGGAIYNGGTLIVSSSTICSNSCPGNGGGIYGSAGTIQVQNTIVARNRASGTGNDVFGGVISWGYNLIGITDGSSGWAPSDLTGSIAAPLDPKLGPLHGNGGRRFTHALLPGSPAIDAGQSFGVTGDQRGAPRPYNDPAIPNRPGGDGADIGAYELGPQNPPGGNFVITRAVTTNRDFGAGSLREAMLASVSGDAITIAPNLNISLTSNLPPIKGDLTIAGNINQPVFINGNNTYEIFITTFDAAPGVVSLSGLVLIGAAGSLGSAIINNGTTVLVDDCSIRNCGGGSFSLFNSGIMRFNHTRIANNPRPIYTQGIMTILNSTVSENSSSTDGFIQNYGTLAITNSTLTFNSAAAGNGGAIFNGQTVIVSSSTICSNSCPGNGPGIYASAGTIELHNTIVAGNKSSGVYKDIFGAVASRGNNLIGAADGSSGWGSSDLRGSTSSPLDPMLGPLRNNGGPTLTHALKFGSVAIDAGKSVGGITSTDQRGKPRPFDFYGLPKPADGDGADIGAFELNPPSPTISRSPNIVTICWPSSGYNLQQTPTLSPPAWTDVTQVPSDDGTTKCVSLASIAGNMFYRLSCGSVAGLDQQQLTASNNAGSPDQWQSFTAGQSGWLKNVQLYLNSPKSPASSPGIIRIYSGEGIGGTPLATENVTFTDPPRFQTFTFSFPPVVLAGRKYTIRFGAPSVSIGWVWYSPANPYSGGAGSIDPAWDYAFKTYVAPACD